jgi:hypothetical protein
MIEISSIAATGLGFQQAQVQNQISANLMKLQMKAQQDLADMLLQNVRLMAAQTNVSKSGVIDIFA